MEDSVPGTATLVLIELTAFMHDLVTMMRSEVAWTAGAGGTRRLMAFAEQPRVRGTKAEALETLEADDPGGADMLKVEEDIWEQVCATGAM
jgi:hypothetical protein